MKKFFLSSSILGAVLFLSQVTTAQADAQKPAEEGKAVRYNTVVAKVGGSSVRFVDVMELLQSYPPEMHRLMSPEQLFALARQQLVAQAALLKKAREAKLHESNDFKKLLQRASDNLLVEYYMQKDLKVNFSEEELKAAYDQYKSEFKPETEVKVRHILVKDEGRAKEIIEKIKGGAAFDDFVSESIDTPSISRRGLLVFDRTRTGKQEEFIRKTDFLPEFTNVVFAMSDGSLSDSPIKTSFGFHVVKREESRQSTAIDFESAKKVMLPSLLVQKAQQGKVKSAMDAVEVSYFDMEGNPEKAPALSLEAKSADKPEASASDAADKKHESLGSKAAGSLK